MPTTKDMVLLPSHILQLYNVFKDEQYKDPKEVEGNHFYILALFFKSLVLKEYIERRLIEPVKFLFLWKMGLLGQPCIGQMEENHPIW
jgi:hypothetical protein